MAMHVRGAVVKAANHVLRRLARRPERPVPRCLSMEVRSEHDVRASAFDLAQASDANADVYESQLRELVALNTPALFLNIVQPRTGPIRVVLRPGDGRSIRFRGSNYFVDAGSEAPEGSEAFAYAPLSHVTTLYPTAPDHPVYVISIEHQGTLTYSGQFPPYLTHLTLAVNGVIIARSERLLFERGTTVYWSGKVA